MHPFNSISHINEFLNQIDICLDRFINITQPIIIHIFKAAVQVHSHFTYMVLLFATGGRCLVNVTPVVKVVIHCVFALL